MSGSAFCSQSLTLPGTDKLYITHSECASEDAYAASSGSGVSKATRELISPSDNEEQKLRKLYAAVMAIENNM